MRGTSEPTRHECEPRINHVGSGALNVGRRPPPESMSVGREGCSMASRTPNECEPQQVSRRSNVAWSAASKVSGENAWRPYFYYASMTPITLLNAVPFRIAQARHWGEPLPKFLARMPTIGWWLGLVIATWLFARQYAGQPAASLAALLVALDPNLAAHGSLVTVDVPYTCMTLLCLWAFLKLYETSAYSRAAVAGIALGLAFCTKYTAFLLLPLCLIAAAAGAWTRKSDVRAMLRAV